METHVQQGFNGKVYISGGTGSFPTAVGSIAGTGTGSAPTYTELPLVGDVGVDMTLDESQVSVRAVPGIKLTETNLLQISLELNIPHVRGDTHREALANALWDRAIVGVCVLDGAINDAGSKGFIADMKITGAPRQEQIGDVMTDKFTLKPCLPGLTGTGQNFAQPSQVAASSGGTLTLI